MKPVIKKDKKEPVPKRPNPFSFRNYDPKSPETFPATSPPPQPVEEDANPFSFFKPPPPKPRTQNKDTGSRLPPQRSSLDDFDDSDEEPIFPKIDTIPIPLFPEDNDFPSEGDEPIFRNISEPKKERNEPLFPKEAIPFVHDKDDKIRELTETVQVLKKRAETAEALVKRHDLKLQEASQKITDLKEKERKESAEMENALKLIEKNLASMKIRAEKAENQVLILQQRLKMNNPQSQDPNHEKNMFVLSMMQKISTEGQQGMNLLFQGMKEFNLLMETLRNMHVISEDV